MRLNIRTPGVLSRGTPALAAAPRRDPRAPWEWALGALALANVLAFFLIYRPFGGSIEELETQLQDLRSRVRAEQGQLKLIRARSEKVEGARGEHEGFMREYFMDRRTTSSTILAEIDGAAKKAGLKARDHTFVIEPVEGSDDVSMMTINANYEGSYADLVQFVNLMDRSRRFLIIDSLQAAPLQQAGVLAARFRMNTFLQESRTGPAPDAGSGVPESAPAPGAPVANLPVAKAAGGGQP
jgi:type IV pilus assembly protein PilO